MTLNPHPRATPPRPLFILALATFGLFHAAPPLALAQTPSDPHEALLQKADDKVNGPSTLTRKDPAAAGDPGVSTLDRAIKELGESPISAILDAAGPDVRRYNDHINTLANPFFEGRAPGSHGNRVAADYIEYWFRQASLRPAFPTDDQAADGSTIRTNNTSFRQPFQHGTDIKIGRQAISMDLGGEGQLQLTPGQDFTVLGFSGSGTATGPIVLAGYSIDKGADGYTSYPADTDLSGKIAIIYRFEPMNESGKSRWAKQGWSPAASLDAKIVAATDRNAAGIIVVNPPGAADPKPKQLLKISDTRSFGNTHTIPIVMVTPAIVDRLIQAADPTDGPRRTLQTFREQFDEQGGIVDLPNARVTISTGISHEPIMTDNVGGILPGKGDLADQYIIIGAHYDHVGFGYTGAQSQNIGKLHPGADDNGSGTSGLLLLTDKLSRAYAELPEGASARSISFMAFSAEEAGLIGSEFFVEHPTLSKSQMYLMLNLDMIGRLRAGKLEVQGTESAAGFYDWLTPHFESSGLEIAHGSEVASNSDHAGFYRKKVPVLFFFTGYHREYHTPEDFAYRINQLGAVKVVDLVENIALAAAQRAEPLVFTPRRRAGESPRASSPENAPAADPAGDDKPPRTGVGRVRFGIAPASYSDDKAGVEVGDVYEGTSAAEAGVKIGDRMIKWNGKEIASVEDWMPLLTKHKPGDDVEVTLLRDGKEITVKATLKAHDQGGR